MPLRLSFFSHRFTLSGLNLERFLNVLLQQNIPLLRVVRQDSRTLICDCYSSDFSSIRVIAQERGWKLENESPLYLSAFFSSLRLRPGLPIGIVLAFVTAFLLSQFVWQIDITGAKAYQADLAAYLEEIGCRPGILRRNVDASALEKALTYRYPKAAWFHVYVSGVRMVVDVTPGVAPPALPKNEPANLIALRGGIVTSVQVFAGTAKVKPGDIVAAGQVLIEGVERAAYGEQSAVRAQGVVMARCWDSHTVQLPAYDIMSTETGRQDVFCRVTTPWIHIPRSDPEAPFLACNTYVEELPVAGCFFPVVYQRITRREVSMEYVARDPAQVVAEAAEAALKYLKTKHFGDEIIDKWVDYCMIEDGSLAAAVTVEWLMDIGGVSAP